MEVEVERYARLYLTSYASAKALAPKYVFVVSAPFLILTLKQNRKLYDWICKSSWGRDPRIGKNLISFKIF